MENKDDLIKLFKNVAEAYKFPVGLIEKDYHLTRILHKISERNIEDLEKPLKFPKSSKKDFENFPESKGYSKSSINNLVFKGGTCLNKCYLDFYRLSEDLDFVYNDNLMNFTKGQIKKILDKLRRELFEIFGELGFKQSKKLGEGWKMLTSEISPRISGLEIITNYISLLDNSLQTIKIEISFRKKLIMLTKRRVIEHKFVDSLGEQVLRKDIAIEVIDLVENFAEKFRALVSRKRLAVRDVFDIYFILKNSILSINNKLINLILVKINETKKFTEKDLIEFIYNLNSRIYELNEKELKALIKYDEEIDIKEMIRLIIKGFEKFKTS